MKIEINNQKTIREIQDEFSSRFEWLKLEFFRKPHSVEAGSHRNYLIPENTSIGKCRAIDKAGKIEITSLMTVAELEQAFTDSFGLSVQVFRKSGNAWLETTVTDKWSLEKQNSLAKEMSSPLT